jgi:hypothetical protein
MRARDFLSARPAAAWHRACLQRGGWVCGFARKGAWIAGIPGLDIGAWTAPPFGSRLAELTADGHSSLIPPAAKRPRRRVAAAPGRRAGTGEVPALPPPCRGVPAAPWMPQRPAAAAAPGDTALSERPPRPLLGDQAARAPLAVLARLARRGLALPAAALRTSRQPDRAPTARRRPSAPAEGDTEAALGRRLAARVEGAMRRLAPWTATAAAAVALSATGAAAALSDWTAPIARPVPGFNIPPEISSREVGAPQMAGDTVRRAGTPAPASGPPRRSPAMPAAASVGAPRAMTGRASALQSAAAIAGLRSWPAPTPASVADAPAVAAEAPLSGAARTAAPAAVPAEPPAAAPARFHPARLDPIAFAEQLRETLRDDARRHGIDV